VTKIKATIIIPVRTVTPYLRETIGFLKKQTEKKFEIIVVTDKKEKLLGVKVLSSGNPLPAYKRNLGAGKARGKILAFLDDDSYPSEHWLENALEIFSDGLAIPTDFLAAVCGPTLTPDKDNIYQKASGWVWGSWFGSGGAGVYRNKVMSRREVDDFPSVNLLVKKEAFGEVRGFDVSHWPGEDTKLCLDLVKLGKKIIYDPKVVVYHHRRPVFLPHMKQISRYALRRGHFVRIFPETSLRLGYLVPSLFTYGIFLGGVIFFFFPLIRWAYLLSISLYFLLLFSAGVEVFLREKNIYLATLVMGAILATHLTYGLLFPFGYFQKRLTTTPHKIDDQAKTYVGG